jgi:cobalt-zinc-cadmium efflux system membrane fusion protein
MKILISGGGLVCVAAASFALAGCNARATSDPAAEAPPKAQVENIGDVNLVRVAKPEQFPIAPVELYEMAPELTVNGVVNPDVSGTVPVVSLASGRAVAVYARLGDVVHKGQVLVRIESPDISAARSDYRKATTDEALARAQLSRANELLERGAIAMKDVEVARAAAVKAKVDVESAAQRLRLLGADTEGSSPFIDVKAPVSGVITEQNVTSAAGVKTLDNSPNLFTIADISRVWVVCDVYENDLPNVRVGQAASIRLTAYPDRVYSGRISDIAPTLDATTRAAKVRIEVANPGVMRLGMFVTATFRGNVKGAEAIVPATAVLHLHDRDWVYTPAGDGQFRRIEVTAGDMLGNRQVIQHGVAAGDKVVANALVLQNTLEQ